MGVLAQSRFVRDEGELGKQRFAAKQHMGEAMLVDYQANDRKPKPKNT